eukprot:CAMPEP_0182909062 /NCGR_PEP_ID=MMETSP0034_2-20130328/35548_1 /TAXON_ID=156128 /ORGANISM="Nephroselmis pyriformis, Strain CCMP717" /LENGTH=61 /DNA_ID=CAMNT_0025045289 /DNA_START=237 /DNA_END=422 /DNA_ORIENTATION=+
MSSPTSGSMPYRRMKSLGPQLVVTLASLNSENGLLKPHISQHADEVFVTMSSIVPQRSQNM